MKGSPFKHCLHPNAWPTFHTDREMSQPYPPHYCNHEMDGRFLGRRIIEGLCNIYAMPRNYWLNKIVSYDCPGHCTELDRADKQAKAGMDPKGKWGAYRVGLP